MERVESSIKGRVVLATVKGDVHDIGKNLVEIILSNNGYEVINLGIKIPPQELIEAYRQHNPDIIGLSGLLVKSAQMMVETVRDFRQDGVAVPVLVGGAALSNRFTRLRIAPEYGGMVAYAPDAMTGLALANTIQEADERAHLAAQLEAETEAMLSDDASRPAADDGQDVPPAQVRHDFPIPNPPDLRLHVLSDYSLERHLRLHQPSDALRAPSGLQGPLLAEDLEGGEPAAALTCATRCGGVEDLVLARSDITANAVFKFFPCRAQKANGC